MIHLIGYSEESTFNHVCTKAEKWGLEYTVLNMDLLEKASTANLMLSDKFLSLRWDEYSHQIDVGDIVYQRAYSRDLGDDNRNIYLGEFLGALSAFLSVSDVVSVNPMYGGIQNSSKISHLYCLRELGFDVPETLAGTDEKSIKKAVNPNGKWISKGVSSIRTKVESVQKQDFSHIKERLLSRSPVQFQKLISGFDVRVHYFCKEFVAVKIVTDAVDYRYAKREGFEIEYESYDVPLSIQIKCRQYMRDNSLVFAGFDFRVNGSEWTVLECNPMPGFDYYDKKLNGRISNMLFEGISKIRNDLIDNGDGSVDLTGIADIDLYLGESRRPSTNHS